MNFYLTNILNTILNKIFNINIASQLIIFDTNFKKDEFHINIDNLELDLSNFNLPKKCTLMGINIKINYNRKLFLIFDKIIIDYDDNILNILEIKKSEKKKKSFVNEIITDIEIKINSFDIFLKKPFSLKISISNLKFKKDFKKINIDKLDINYNNCNFLTLKFINLEFNDNKNNIIIHHIDILLEPKVYSILQELNFYTKQGNNNKNKKISIIIYFINIKFLDIYINIINLLIDFLDLTVECENFNIFDKTDVYLKLQNIFYSNNTKSIDNIYLLISDKLLKILDITKNISDKTEYETNNENKNINLDNIIDNYSNKINETVKNIEINDNLSEYILVENNTETKEIEKKNYINKIKIDFKNKEKIFSINIIGLKNILYTDKSYYIRLQDLFIRDLTEKKWDYILYKEDITNIIEFSFNIIENKKDYDIFEVYIKPCNIVINLDEYCLEKSLPLLRDMSIVIDNIIKKLPDTPIFLKECIVRESKISLSYKPRNLKLQEIFKGNSQELIKIGVVHDFNVFFNELRVYNKFSLGELFIDIFKNCKSIILKEGIYLLLQNEKLKLLFSPLRHFKKITEKNILEYFKNISLDIVDSIDNFYYLINNKNKKKILSQSLKSLQYYSDKEKKNDRKYKN